MIKTSADEVTIQTFPSCFAFNRHYFMLEARKPIKTTKDPNDASAQPSNTIKITHITHIMDPGCAKLKNQMEMKKRSNAKRQQIFFIKRVKTLWRGKENQKMTSLSSSKLLL
ncbi:CLUMA_CG018712, isoform A [Clunio marinus]|uniref:CLUMA_CG018712, isoform A n=1 Tax=Clunio marinus TaxID=568069 RepID=A0A1J1J026_9DIPT|nr:CLUMA_CG018712, isoform A [Clunio marinus]